MTSLENGALLGYPVQDVVVRLEALETDERSPSVEACEIAGSMACRIGLIDAKPIILEPYMRLEIECPESYLGAVVSSIMGRLGRVESVDESAGGKVVSGVTSLRSLFGYATELRSLTSGKASLSSYFLQYERLPKNLQDDMVRKQRGDLA